MVSSPSVAVQVAENDKRRKTQHTMEKAKANHLTRQLQMRLQYARLKVEHGWQKQNLNEVENLYFHNSHLRGGAKSASFAPTEPIMTAQPLLASLFPLSTPTQLLNIGSIQNTSLHNTPTTITEPENPEQVIVQISQPVVAAATSSATTSDVSINDDHSPDDLLRASDSATTITPFIQSNVIPSLPLVMQDPIPTTPNVPTGTWTLPSPQSPTSSTNPTSTSHYSPLKIPRGRNNKHPAGPKGSHQNLTAKEMLDFAPASTLTYDSFWSSHSTSAPSSRSPRSAIISGSNGAAGLAPAFQTSTLFSNGFSVDLSQFINPSLIPTPTTMTTSIEHPRNSSIV